MILSSKLSPREQATADKIRLAAIRRNNVAASIATIMAQTGASLQEASTLACNIIKSRGETISSTKQGVMKKTLLSAADEVLKQAGESWAETVQPDNKSYTDTGTKVTDTSKDVPPKISDYETKAQYIQRLVNAGYSLAAAQSMAAQRFGPTAATVGGNWTTKRDRGNALKGPYQSTTKIPNKGELKKASTDIPYWIKSFDIDTSHIHNNTNNLRSASLQEIEIQKAMYESVPEMMARKDEERDARHTARKKILSASSEIPSWAYAANLVQ